MIGDDDTNVTDALVAPTLTDPNYTPMSTGYRRNMQWNTFVCCYY